MEELLRSELNCSSVLPYGEAQCGFVSKGSSFLIDGKKVFVKVNSSALSRIMFEGEFHSLQEIRATNSVKAPEPIKVFTSGGTTYHVMEYVEMSPLKKQAASLGERVALMHLENQKRKTSSFKDEGFIGSTTEFVDKFGFSVPTTYGSNVLTNEWTQNWTEFFLRHRLKIAVDTLENEVGDRDFRDLWPFVERNIPKLLPNSLDITPSLQHGDLWAGNVAETVIEPCVFDPTGCYGHHEFDLALSRLTDLFPAEFYDSYHSVVPKSVGHDVRTLLYQLYYTINFWTYFGNDRKSMVIDRMKELAKC